MKTTYNSTQINFDKWNNTTCNSKVIDKEMKTQKKRPFPHTLRDMSAKTFLNIAPTSLQHPPVPPSAGNMSKQYTYEIPVVTY